MDKHLFIISMNNTGSTLLSNLIALCANAVPLTGRRGEVIEGQHLAKDYMPNYSGTKYGRLWSEQHSTLVDEKYYNWDQIKKIWNASWKRHLHYHSSTDRMLVEKSPPNVYRVPMLMREFPNSYFIFVLRDPYAVSEGIKRRRNVNINRCVDHWIRCTHQQRENLSIVGARGILVCYEDLCDTPYLVEEQIKNFIPELSDLSLIGEVKCHSLDGQLTRAPKNLNDKQIANLLPGEVKTITNKILESDPSLLGGKYITLENNAELRKKFNHPERIVLGVGSGRCGTLSLAVMLNSQEDTLATHEAQLIPWDTNDFYFDRFLNTLENGSYKVRCDVANYHLPYVEKYVERYGDTIKVICLKRNREETINSFMRYTQEVNYGYNFWRPNQIENVLKEDRTKELHKIMVEWRVFDMDKEFINDLYRLTMLYRWDKCFPKYPVEDKRQALGMFYDEYYTRASELEIKYQDSFRVFPMEMLNTVQGQTEILKWAGYDSLEIKEEGVRIPNRGGGVG